MRIRGYTEYGMIIALLVVVILTALTTLGAQIHASFSKSRPAAVAHK